MDNLNEFIESLAYESAFSLNLTYDSLSYFVFSQNCKYFDILNHRPVFNIFKLIGIDYKFTQNGCYIVNNNGFYDEFKGKSKILSINSLSPEIGLSHYEQSYKVIYQNLLGEIDQLEIVQPSINGDITNGDKNSICRNGNKLLISLKSFNDISFIEQEHFDGRDLWIDLRNNQGGEVKKIIAILSCFYPIGSLLFYLRKKEQIFSVVSKDRLRYIKPSRIFFLVNNKTASAAEMMALSMKIKFNATIIGSKTEGKWIVNSQKQYNDFFIKFPEYLFVPSDNTTLTLCNGILPDLSISDSNLDKFLLEKFGIVEGTEKYAKSYKKLNEEA